MSPVSPVFHTVVTVSFNWPWWLCGLRHYLKFKSREGLRSQVRIPAHVDVAHFVVNVILLVIDLPKTKEHRFIYSPMTGILYHNLAM